MKRLFTIILALLMLLAVGCTPANAVYPISNDGDIFDAIAEDRSIETTSTDAPQYISNSDGQQTILGELQLNTEKKPVTRKMYSLTANVISPLRSTAFNEGVAWASFRDEETKIDYVGLINTDGRILYMDDSKQYLSAKNTFTVTQLYQGRTLIDDDVIIDQYGNPLFSCMDESMKILGYSYSDGLVFLSKHTDATFSNASSDYLYILDPDFSLIETGIEIKPTSVGYDSVYNTQWYEEKYPLSVNDTIYCLCDGVYYCNSDNRCLYINLKTGAYISNGAHMQIETYDDNYAVVQEYVGYYLLPINEFASVSTHDELMSLLDSEDCIYIGDNAAGGTTRGLIASHINDNKDSNVHRTVDRWWYSDNFGGCFYRRVKGYGGTEAECTPYYECIDVSGNTILRFPAFPEGVTYKGVSDFYNGYSAIYLIGVDGEEYDSVIDTNGNLQYEPISFIGYKYGYGGIFGYSKEESTFGVLSPTGKLLRIYDGLPWIGSEDTFYMNTNGYIVAIHDGYIFYHSENDAVTAYYSLDGSKAIERVYAEFDYNGFLVIDDKGNIARNEIIVSPSDEATEQKPTQTQSPKRYKDVNSFSIEGKWKNTGTYTYGQAQSGAIIVFNSTNCNFVSPQDTYAFYKDGSNFRLDCTTYVFSQTLSFTVKIIDDDHIDVYNGSDYIELTRVAY